MLTPGREARISRNTFNWFFADLRRCKCYRVGVTCRLGRPL